MLSIGYDLQNRYHILGILGQGGMGAVYRAHDRRLDAECVVKEMLVTPETIANPVDAAEQFKREASVLAMLRHPHLPRVIDHFVDQGNYYLVMDFIEGQSLLKRIGMQGLPEATVRNYANQLLDVLGYIHGRGVLHRDIKPSNIIVQPDGRLVMVDFGLVKMLDPTIETRTFLRGVGTPEYAPPEQAIGGTDARSDIYSLGATLYHAITGQPPPHVALRSAGSNVPPIRELAPAVSAQLEYVVNRAMAMNRDQRYQTVAAMRDDLNAAAPALRKEKAPKSQNKVANADATIRMPGNAAPRSKRLSTLVAIAGGVVILVITGLVIKGIADNNAPANNTAGRNADVAAQATSAPASATAAPQGTATPQPTATTPAQTATPAPPTVTPFPTDTPVPPFPTAYVASTKNVYPRIDRVELPESVGRNEAFEIAVYATNLGNDALGGGSVTFSFPHHDGRATVQEVTILEADAPIISDSAECKLPDEQSHHVARNYSQNTKCGTATLSNCSKRINVDYAITEVYHKPWLRQEQHYLRVRIVPAADADHVTVYVRSSMIAPAKVNIPCSPTTYPQKGAAENFDQQGFPVLTYVITVR